MHRSWLHLASWTPGRGLRGTKNTYFSLLTHTKKLLLVTLYDLAADTGVSFRTDGGGGGGLTEAEGQTDVEVEIVV